MKKEILIGDVTFDLFKTESNHNSEDYLLKSRTYNSGLCPFLGSDTISTYVYFVEKEKVSQFIEEINKVIYWIENSNVNKNRYYLESINDFSFLHKVVDGSNYDFFISNFDSNMIPSGDYELMVKKEEEFNNLVMPITSLYIKAGADFDDVDIHYFALYWLLKKKNKIVKDLYVDFQDDLEDCLESFSSDYLPFVKNTKDKDIVLKCLKDYFLNLPQAIQDSNNYYGLIRECFKLV